MANAALKVSRLNGLARRCQGGHRDGSDRATRPEAARLLSLATPHACRPWGRRVAHWRRRARNSVQMNPPLVGGSVPFRAAGLNEPRGAPHAATPPQGGAWERYGWCAPPLLHARRGTFAALATSTRHPRALTLTPLVGSGRHWWRW